MFYQLKASQISGLFLIGYLYQQYKTLVCYNQEPHLGYNW